MFLLLGKLFHVSAIPWFPGLFSLSQIAAIVQKNYYFMESIKQGQVLWCHAALRSIILLYFHFLLTPKIKLETKYLSLGAYNFSFYYFVLISS